MFFALKNFMFFDFKWKKIFAAENGGGAQFVTTINYSGSLNNGRYWAIIKYITTNQWCSCNEKVVFKIKADELNNKTSHFLFFLRK